ncbi:short chain dehydrogenase [Actinomycetota bacterium]
MTIDLSDPGSIDAAYASAGALDAVVCTAGNVSFKSLAELTREDLLASFTDKALGQIELVRRGLPHVAETGSFTLTSGITARSAVLDGTAASMAAGAIESFVVAAAPELAPRRITAISPTVLSESAEAYDSYFPGYEPVPAEQVARAYVRAVEGRETGRVDPVS